MSDSNKLESFIAEWALTGGSELANTQSFVNGLCVLIGVDPPKGCRTDDAHNDYVFERRVLQKEADGTVSFGRIDAYKRHCFVLEAKQGSDADRKAAESGEADLDIFGQTAAARFKRGTAKRGTPAWSKAMVEARGQAPQHPTKSPAPSRERTPRALPPCWMRSPLSARRDGWRMGAMRHKPPLPRKVRA